MKNLKIEMVGLAFLLLSLFAFPSLAADSTIIYSPQLRTLEPLVTDSKLERIAPAEETVAPTDPVKQIEPVTKIVPIKVMPELKDNLREKKNDGTDWGKLVQSMFTEYWVQLLALIVSVIGVILAVSGFSLANKKKRKYLKKYLHEIDDVYSSFKWKSRRCEVELYRLQDQVEEHLKNGKIDENTYHLLEARIQKYLDEMKESDHRQPREVSEMQKEAGHKTAAKKLSDQIDEAGKDL